MLSILLNKKNHIYHHFGKKVGVVAFLGVRSLTDFPNIAGNKSIAFLDEASGTIVLQVFPFKSTHARESMFKRFSSIFGRSLLACRY